MDPALRTRLEGADEIIEKFTAGCTQLKALFVPGWRHRFREHDALVAELARDEQRVMRARKTASNLGDVRELKKLLEAATRAEAELAPLIDRALKHNGSALDGTFHQKLQRLLDLARPPKLEPAEHVLATLPMSDGTLSVTTHREYFEGADTLYFITPTGQPTLNPLRDLLVRLRDAFGMKDLARDEKTRSTVASVTRLNKTPTPGLLLAWSHAVLFLPRGKSGDLLTALLQPTKNEAAVPLTDVEVLHTIACVVPWISEELITRVEAKGLDWVWRRADLSCTGTRVAHRSQITAPYQLDSAHEEVQRVLDVK